jgi:hypothetical protein
MTFALSRSCGKSLGFSVTMKSAFPSSLQRQRIVFGIRGDFEGCVNIHLFGSLADKVDHSADEIWSNAQAPQDLLVFVQNVIRYKPDEIAFLGPFVQQIGTRIFASDIWLSETRNARYENVCVHDAARLLLLTFPRQR